MDQKPGYACRRRSSHGMTPLPWLLLVSVLLVRYLMARKLRAGFWLDLMSVPAWLLFYADASAWPLLAVPLIFAFLDVQAIRIWWR